MNLIPIYHGINIWLIATESFEMTSLKTEIVPDLLGLSDNEF